jgi:hypothetical protein
MDEDRQTYTTQQENFKNVVQVLVWKITNFGRQAALFNGASMGAITWGFSEVRQLNSPVRTVWQLLPGCTRPAPVIMRSFDC